MITDMTIRQICSYQDNGHGIVAVIDRGHQLDPNELRKGGVDLEDLLVCQPSTDDQADQVVAMLVKSNCVDLIVDDSAYESTLIYGDEDCDAG